MPIVEPVRDNRDPVTKVNELLASLKPAEDVQEEQSTPPSEQESEELSGESESQDASAQTEEAEESEETEALTEAEAQEVSNFQELLDSLDLDAGKVYDLPVLMSEGIEPVTLGKLKDAYQDYRRTAQRQDALEREKQQFLAWKADQEKQYQSNLETSAGFLNREFEKLQKEIQSVKWDELREHDPAEYAARQTDYQRRQTSLQQEYSQIQQLAQQQLAQQQQEHRRWYEEHLRRGREQLMKDIPEWKDPKVHKAEVEPLHELAQSYGYNQQELNGVADPRFVRMVRDLWKAKSLLGEGKKAVQKVKRLPPMRKPGAPVSQAQAAQSKIAELTRKAKETGTEQDKIAAINALLAHQAQAQRKR